MTGMPKLCQGIFFWFLRALGFIRKDGSFIGQKANGDTMCIQYLFKVIVVGFEVSCVSK